MAGKNQHAVRHPDGGWGVKGAGNTKFTSRHETQAEAVKAAREIAKHQESELFVHGRNGQIRERDSYGNDPFPPKG
ncbi:MULTISPECIES: DUF2188 domain-containing protein [Vibrio]|uniref:DUF2188 domain-containing protein n=1 Tax=Vibrio TaxID=662 RepID=UPI0002377545|nr:MULTISPECIES: DUF2188 domain-containing protein [Vibrio]MCG6267945.1 DUF2188 domain-containing protein [Vibrio furnissii]